MDLALYKINILLLVLLLYYVSELATTRQWAAPNVICIVLKIMHFIRGVLECHTVQYKRTECLLLDNPLMFCVLSRSRNTA